MKKIKLVNGHYATGIKASDIEAKVGDKFLVVVDSAPYRKDSIIKLHYDDESDCPRFIDEEGRKYFVSFSCLAPAAPSWDNLQVGDTLVLADTEYKILAVLGEAFLLSGEDKKFAGSWYTVAEVREYGYELKGMEPEKTTLTKSEIEKRLGLDDGTLEVVC